MLPSPFSRALVLTGPTGSGKTRLALALARKLEAEIISMDSMALYRRMDIGTAKPTSAERRDVPHHLVDVLEPWESASVAWWLEQAARCCADIERRGKQVLFVGGTPLYLKGLMFGLFDGPPANLDLRRRLTREAEELGSAALHDRLAAIDPVAAGRLHPNDLRRIIRALEVHEITGRPISDWQQQWRSVQRGADIVESPLHAAHSTILWLDVPRPELYARIDRRVEEMFATGLVEEVAELRRLERPVSTEAAQALGYKEVFSYLDGHADLAETIDKVRTRTRQFAKRQIGWFRHLPDCRGVTSELTADLWRPTMGV